MLIPKISIVRTQGTKALVTLDFGFARRAALIGGSQATLYLDARDRHDATSTTPKKP